jgi:hypothetical protein
MRTTAIFCLLGLSLVCSQSSGCAPESGEEEERDSGSELDDDTSSSRKPDAKVDAGRKPDAGASKDSGSDNDDDPVDSDEPANTDSDEDSDVSPPDSKADAGAKSDAKTPAQMPVGDSLLPWKTGNSWTYKVSGSKGASMKVTTIGAEEPVGGTGPNKDKRAFKVTTDKGGGDKTESWQAVVGDSVVRYREVAYMSSTGMPELEEVWDPYKVHVHSDAEHRSAGAKWVEEYEETKLTLLDGMMTSAMASDAWSVDAPKVSVTVPAGTFEAVVLIKASPSGMKTYWYVPGVGKVKETGGQTEELVSYKIIP